MNQKERNEIARIWASGILLATDTTSFDDELSVEDQEKIVAIIHEIAYKLLKNRPQLHSLPSILDHVLGPLEP